MMMPVPPLPAPVPTPTHDKQRLDDCIDACLACELACAELSAHDESVTNLTRHELRAGSDCADICGATAHVLSHILERELTLTRAQVEACARACATFGAECNKRPSSHFRVCAEACRRCETACRALLETLP